MDGLLAALSCVDLSTAVLVCVAVPSQLRLAVVEALGPMSHLLPSEKLEEQLPKLLPGILALYKKHAETCHVSKVWSEHCHSDSVVGGDRPGFTPMPCTWPCLVSPFLVPALPSEFWRQK